MGCGCGGGTTPNTAKYQITTPDGRSFTVSTLTEAQALAVRTGGTFQAVPA